jgi:RND family efflux transporter MFP subunit
LHLKPLPVWIPEVYRLHERIVDVEGYVALHSSRYSVPVAWIGRRVEVRETKNKLEIQLDSRHIVTHQRVPEGEYQRITLAEHRPPRGQGIKRSDPHPEEQAILQRAPELADYLAALKKRGHRYLTIALRQLLRIVREYPRQPVLSAVSEAARYGLYDLDRLERMVLRAPVDGAVYRRRTTPGSKLMLDENSENSAQVVALYDPKKLQVRVDVPLAEAAGVSVGQKAQITIEVLRDKVFTGIVTRITNEADIQKNTLQVKVHIDAPAEQLKPEMLARVQFMSMDTGQKISDATARSGSTGTVTFAPENTLQKEGSNTFVWIVDKGRGVALKKVVVLGTQKREGYVEVTTGLQPGDSIITGDTLSLRDGQRVRMMDMDKVDKKEGGAQHGSH